MQLQKFEGVVNEKTDVGKSANNSEEYHRPASFVLHIHVHPAVSKAQQVISADYVEKLVNYLHVVKERSLKRLVEVAVRHD